MSHACHRHEFTRSHELQPYLSLLHSKPVCHQRLERIPMVAACNLHQAVVLNYSSPPTTTTIRPTEKIEESNLVTGEVLFYWSFFVLLPHYEKNYGHPTKLVFHISWPKKWGLLYWRQLPQPKNASHSAAQWQNRPRTFARWASRRPDDGRCWRDLWHAQRFDSSFFD